VNWIIREACLAQVGFPESFVKETEKLQCIRKKKKAKYMELD